MCLMEKKKENAMFGNICINMLIASNGCCGNLETTRYYSLMQFSNLLTLLSVLIIVCGGTI